MAPNTHSWEVVEEELFSRSWMDARAVNPQPSEHILSLPAPPPAQGGGGGGEPTLGRMRRLRATHGCTACRGLLQVAPEQSGDAADRRQHGGSGLREKGFGAEAAEQGMPALSLGVFLALPGLEDL